ncbi:MAG: 3-oxoacyl-ACP reductase FabG [Clostridium sp.]|uniref:elongation factor P 5-aminopentanone reductase n=1 Tax=Butyribacter sp. TaxID=2822465 RepID=UPI002A995B9E|nr:3-oxoacyl-ACP reductase FabG [Clostridium sp.]MDY5181005.1 3-oxoacyl-ACP reductase FabG [Butyribacter sp.]
MNKTVVVTGASRGIGRAVSIYYAQNGFNVCICCRKNSEMLEKVRQEILNYGVECIAYTGDIGNFQECETFFKLITQSYSKIDILVNNAGISHIGLLQDMSPDEWHNIVEANLTSVFNCCKLAIPIMLSRHAGKIVNISSVWGCVGASTEVAYSATKGGINSFTKALAKELAPSNIQVNAIACGIIDTDMNGFLNDDELQSVLDEVPAGRIGKPEDVAKLAFDITNTSDYLTGQVIKLDGGWI